MKTLDQTVDEARAVAMLRALANPARFRIVQILAGRRECVTGELVDALPLSQSSVSEHLSVLKDAGIVQGTLDDPNRCYCLDPDAFAFLRGVLGGIEQQACC
jgi:ArsR family transcriptional regulator, arsenate/arsenite/antimonite-responsive transcriptional repressor